MPTFSLRAVLLALVAGFCLPAAAADTVAVVKVFRGDGLVQRGDVVLPLTLGMALEETDRVRTGAHGAVGITFRDGTLLSVGADSDLLVDQFRFDSTTHDGAFETTLSKGKMFVVSGKIAKHQQDAMKVHTPSTTLGVRGTEFLVEACPTQ